MKKNYIGQRAVLCVVVYSALTAFENEPLVNKMLKSQITLLAAMPSYSVL